MHAARGHARPPRPHGPDDGRRRARVQRASSACGAAWTPRATSRSPSGTSPRRSSCGATTTTAATRRGSAGPTRAPTTSSAARRSSGAEAGPRRTSRRPAARRTRTLDTMPKDRIPTSRIARSAKIGRLAAGQGTRQVATRVTNVARSEQGKKAALEKRHVEAAEQIVTALGTMKGAAMKLGQVLSFLDVGLVPEEYREEFQRKLGALRDAAPKVRFADMRKVIESELGEKLSDVFVEFDEDPDRGRVDRPGLPRPPARRRPRGRGEGPVPARGDAVRADMQNLGMILRLMRPIAPGLDVKATADEIRARIDEELDYELEAANQRAPGAHLPRPPVHRRPRGRHRALARARAGQRVRRAARGFEDVKRIDQDAARPGGRDRLPLLLRLHVPPPAVLRRPAPRQLPADGRRPGRVPRLRPVQAHAQGRSSSSSSPASAPGTSSDAERASRRSSRETGFLRDPDRFEPTSCSPSSATRRGGTCSTTRSCLEPEIATQVMIEMADPRSSHFGQMRHETLPADHIFGRRVEMLTLAVLAQLRRLRQLAPDRPRVDVRRRARHRARPPGGRVLRGRRGGAAEPRRAAQTSWTWTSEVVPGRPLGRPAVMPTRCPRRTQPELDHPPRGGVDQLLGDLVARQRRRLDAPHQAAAAHGLAAGGEGVDRARRGGGRRSGARSGR